MRNPNPWFVPPNSPLSNEHVAKASSEQSRSTDQDDEFDLDVMEMRARRLRAEMSNLCTGKQTSVVYIATSMFLADVLEQYPKKLRKRMLDDTIEFLLKATDR
jgi:hypothetical protein